MKSSEFINEDRIDLRKRKPAKGTLAWEREQRARKEYLQNFAQDPHGKLNPGDKIAGPGGTSTYLGKVNEGVISGAVDKLKQMLFGKKAPEHNLLPITEEQRDLIRQHFKSSNVNIKYGTGEYVIKMNVHAEHGKTSLAFYNDNGQLMCGIAHWGSLDDRLTKGRIPIMHTTHAINNPDDIEKIKVYGN